MTTKVKEWILYAAWLCLYILCVGLGTVENIEGAGKVFFALTANIRLAIIAVPSKKLQLNNSLCFVHSSTAGHAVR